MLAQMSIVGEQKLLTGQEYVECTFDAEHTNYHEVIQTIITDSFFLKKLTYESDVCIQEKEFYYLMNISVPSYVSAYDVEQGISHLMKKQQFSSVTICLNPLEDGYHLHVKLQANWIFNTLKFHGVMFGKDRFRQYYEIEYGDVFDNARHERSLKKIKEVFAKEGYFNAEVTGSVSYNETNRTVRVDIWLQKHEQFIIGKSSLEIQGDTHLDGSEKELLSTKITTRFMQKVYKTPYNLQTLNTEVASLKTYVMERGYLNATIELQEKVDYANKTVFLTLLLTLDKKRTLVFLGNSFFSQEQLFEMLLVFGRSLAVLPATFLAEEMIKLYQQKGFDHISIETREEEFRSFFIIQEGKRARIDRINLLGCQHKDVDSMIHRFFSSILDQYYDQDRVDTCINSFMKYYAEEGYIDAIVISQAYAENELGDSVLSIEIQEGTQYFFKHISVAEYESINDLGPFRSINHAEKPVIFNDVRLRDQHLWLVRYMQAHGKTYPEITPEIQKEGSYVSVVWHVRDQKKEHITFGKVIVRGDYTFPFDFIMREMTFSEGEPWDRDKIKRSLANLKKLGVFESVHIYPDAVTTSDTQKSVIVQLHPDDRYETRLRAGFAIQQATKEFSFTKLTYRAGGSFWIKNPFNCGDRFSFDADASRAERRIVGEYHRPWLGSQHVELIARGYGIQFQQPGKVGPRNNIYQVNQLGTLLGLMKHFDSSDVGGNIGIEWMETTIGDNSQSLFAQEVARAIQFEPALLDRKIPFFMFEPSLMIDHTDNRLNPTKGLFLLYSLKGMIPVQKSSLDSYFVRLILEQSFYIPFDQVVCAVRLRLGHIFHKDFSSIMPSERFYLGGANSLRGYDRDYAPPLGIFLDEKCGSQVVPQGGKSMINVNLECRFPIYKMIKGVLFQDLGVLSGNDFNDFKQRGVLAATGFGIRYDLPIGPLRFDIGWRWKGKDSLSPAYAWFLTFGHAF